MNFWSDFYFKLIELIQEKEEFGPGSQQEQKSELVAKDDNQDKTEAGDKSEQMTADENEAEENDESQKPKELEQIDEVCTTL